MSTNLHIPKKCEYCGNLFTARTTVTRYCSHKCNSRHYKQLKREQKVEQALKETQAQTAYSTSEAQNAKPGATHKEYLSITEASQLIGVSRWTIQRMIKRGQLKAVAFGRKHIIAKNHIDNLFNQ